MTCSGQEPVLGPAFLASCAPTRASPRGCRVPPSSHRHSQTIRFLSPPRPYRYAGCDRWTNAILPLRLSLQRASTSSSAPAARLAPPAGVEVARQTMGSIAVTAHPQDLCERRPLARVDGEAVGPLHLDYLPREPASVPVRDPLPASFPLFRW